MKHIQIESISVEELEQRIVEGIFEKVKDYISNQEPEDEKYLTRKETAQMLGVSLPTLDNLTNNGIINFSRIGRIKRYKLSDIVEAMENLSHKQRK